MDEDIFTHVALDGIRKYTKQVMWIDQQGPVTEASQDMKHSEFRGYFSGLNPFSSASPLE